MSVEMCLYYALLVFLWFGALEHQRLSAEALHDEKQLAIILGMWGVNVASAILAVALGIYIHLRNEA
jgi:hypothetical protein